MGTRKSKTHEITVKIRFDKPVTRGAAVRAFNNYHYGEFYSTLFEADTDGWNIGKLGKAR